MGRRGRRPLQIRFASQGRRPRRSVIMKIYCRGRCHTDPCLQNTRTTIVGEASSTFRM